MTEIWTDATGLICDATGVLVCPTCPCAGTGTGSVTCCFNELLFSCYKFTLAGLTANNGGDCDTHCTQLNVEWQVDWDSGCTWLSGGLNVGAYCDNCGTTYCATMTVTDAGGGNCTVTVTLEPCLSDDTCADGSIIYQATFASTVSVDSFVLNFVSASTLCANHPATITVAKC